MESVEPGFVNPLTDGSWRYSVPPCCGSHAFSHGEERRVSAHSCCLKIVCVGHVHTVAGVSKLVKDYGGLDKFYYVCYTVANNENMDLLVEGESQQQLKS